MKNNAQRNAETAEMTPADSRTRNPWLNSTTILHEDLQGLCEDAAHAREALEDRQWEPAQPEPTHPSPCAELERRWRWASKAAAAFLVVAAGAWAPLWIQVGKSMERDTDRRLEIVATAASASKETAELRLQLMTLTTQSNERFQALDSRILANQGEIKSSIATALQEIRKLQVYTIP
jgi:hypothetical protein